MTSNNNRLTSSLLSLVEMTRMHENYARTYGKLIRHDDAPTAVATVTPDTKRSRTTTTTSPIPRIFGLDCEMVKIQTHTGEERHTVARTTLVEFKDTGDDDEADEKPPPTCTILVDEFCKIPKDAQVIDLLTEISGVTVANLEAAKYDTVADLLAVLQTHISPHDVLIGHSLHIDLAALEMMHPTIIETSFFFRLKDAPNFTLGLKDCAVVALGSATSASLQKKGEAHDSITDATFAVQIALAIAAQTRANVVGFELDIVPERFTRRLTFKNMETLPKNEEEFLTHLDGSTGGVRIVSKRPQCWSVEFDSSEHCIASFLRLAPVDDMTHKDGYPMKDGFRAKRVRVDESCVAEVVCYVRQDLSANTFELQVPNTEIGRVMGPKGKRVIALQRMSGARIGTGQRTSKSTLVKIEADDKRKVAVAVSLITRAQSGEEFGVVT